MNISTLAPRQSGKAERFAGYAHVAIAAGDERAVDLLSARLKSDGYVICDGPRRTGDGYYECCVLDPDGNRVEITADKP
ncbi:MAG: VOC family protein [Elusimicrobiaceae bacterium]|nr:VOC family protein [Elusimicrobiaceae bacterium]